MHLSLPNSIFVEADWALLGNVLRSNENAEDLRKLTLAALLTAGRTTRDLPVFWTAPLQKGMLDPGNDAVLFHHLVHFGRTMDFTRMDFLNAELLFPKQAFVRPSAREIAEARVLGHLLTNMRRHWRQAQQDCEEERQASGLPEEAIRNMEPVMN